MQVFRIAKSQYSKDLSGYGARIYGGRWNEKNIAVLYTSQSRALAGFEYLVHVSSLSTLPVDLSITCIEIPNRIIPKKVSRAKLPRNYRIYPAPPVLAEIGTKWALSKESLLLQVPSAVVENEFNILINPMHPDIKLVKIKNVKDFTLDKRLLKI